MEERGAAVMFLLNFYKCATFAPLDNPWQFIYCLFHNSSLEYAV